MTSETRSWFGRFARKSAGEDSPASAATPAPSADPITIDPAATDHATPDSPESPVPAGPRRIGIFGSCVSRDVFGLANDPGVRIAPYIARSTIVSAALGSALKASSGGDRAQDAPASLLAGTCLGTPANNFERNADTIDRTKSWRDVLAGSRPSVLVVDLIDERFNLVLAEDGSLATSFLANRPGNLRDSVPFRTAIVSRLWRANDLLFRAAAARFVAGVYETLPNVRVVIHRAFWAEESSDGASVFEHGPKTGPRDESTQVQELATVREVNANLAEKYDILADFFGDADIVEAPAALRIADPDHVWGRAPYHFIPAYYDHVRDQIAALLGTLPEEGVEPDMPKDAPAGDLPHNLAGEIVFSGEQPIFVVGRDAGRKPDAAVTGRHPRPGSPEAEMAEIADQLDHDPMLAARLTAILTDDSPEAILTQLIDRALDGNAELACRIGKSLAHDGLVARDLRTSFDLLVVAAVLGSREAMTRVGLCLLEGRGVAADPAMGQEWLRLSGYTADRDIEERIGDLYLQGRLSMATISTPGATPPQVALAYLRRAAKAGSASAALKVARIHAAEGDEAREAYWRRQAETLLAG